MVNLDKLTYAGDPANLEGICRGSAYHFVQGDICDAPVVEGSSGNMILTQCSTSRRKAMWTAVSGIPPYSCAPTCWEPRPSWRRPGRHGSGRMAASDQGSGSSMCPPMKSTDPLRRRGSFPETSPCRPNNPYAASKAAGDLLVSSYIHTYGFPANVMHCGNNYGPRQHREKFLPTVIRNLLEGKEIRSMETAGISGTGSMWRIMCGPWK